MSVHKVVNGDGTVSWKARTKDLNRRSIQATFRTERDAKRWDREQAEKKDRGVQPRPNAGRLTFAAWCERYIEDRKLSHRTRTAEGVETHVRLHFAPTFGARRLSSITPQDVQQWVNAMAQTHAPGTVGLSFKWLRAIFNAAVRAKELGESPCVGIVLPKKPTERRDALTVEQVERILAELDPRYSTVALLAARTGMRQGECLGLRWKHVDVEAGTIQVAAQLGYEDGSSTRLHLTDPKTPTSVRLLYVDEVVINALVAHREQYGTGTVRDDTDGGVVVDDLVFSSRNGTPITRSSWSRVWPRVGRLVGLEPGKGMHQLRHFAGSVMMRSGAMSLVEIRDALGHASLTELDRYCHTFATDRKGAMRAAMAATFGDDTNVHPLRRAG